MMFRYLSLVAFSTVALIANFYCIINSWHGACDTRGGHRYNDAQWKWQHWILGLFFLYFWNFSNKQCKFFSKLMWKNSNPFIFVILLEKDENKQKEAGFDPYIINTFRYVLVSMQVSDTNA